MKTTNYGYRKEVKATFIEAIEKAKQALKNDGFGVLTEIDIKDTLKNKLNVEMENYTILGACHPPSAYQSIQSEIEIGLMLPCNVIVFQKKDAVFVSAIMPTVAMGMIENSELGNVALEIKVSNRLSIEMNKIINIKNMVCNRCIKVVTDILKNNHIDFDEVTLGILKLTEDISNENKEFLNTLLKKEGFEILENKDAIIISKIKALIIKNIHQRLEKPEHQNFSKYLTLQIGIDYSYMSKLFSELEGKTIEQYTIEQRIERAKELIIYKELTLSQISYELNYSSPQHLSRQFKQVTGLTPTEFKRIGQRKKLDNI